MHNNKIIHNKQNAQIINYSTLITKVFSRKIQRKSNVFYDELKNIKAIENTLRRIYLSNISIL